MSEHIRSARIGGPPAKKSGQRGGQPSWRGKTDDDAQIPESATVRKTTRPLASIRQALPRELWDALLWEIDTNEWGRR